MAKILIVEDDKDLNGLISTCFEDNGFVTTCCYNGLEALEQFENEEFDLILSDIMMPVLDGFSLVEKIRSSRPRSALYRCRGKNYTFNRNRRLSDCRYG